jgi:polysaccharide biosynthesis protein VpsM
MDITRLRARSIAALSCVSFLVVSTLPAQDIYTPIDPKPLTLADGSSVDDSVLPPAEGPNYSTTLSDTKSDSKNRVDIKNDDAGISATPHKFHYAFRLTLRGVYDDNIFLSETDKVDDYYFAIEPGLTLGYGDIVERQENYIRLDYAPSIFLFADHSESNAVQHLIRLEGQHRFSRLTLTFSQDVQILDGTNLTATTSTTSTGAPTLNLDAGGSTAINIYTSNAAFAYDLTGKTFLSGGVHWTTWDYENDLISSSFFSGDLFFNYNYSPKLVVGIGGTGGYNWVDSPSPDQTFEQINVRLTYQLTGKISLNASAGVEFRQFENNNGDHVSPVYEIGATYQPFDGTTLSLRGSRRTMNSAVFAEQDYASTSIVFGARQRLFQRIFLGLTLGYENSDYFSTVDFYSATRTDNYYFVQPAIDVMVTRWMTVGAYYLHRENDSNVKGFSFDDNQVGIRASFTF